MQWRGTRVDHRSSSSYRSRLNTSLAALDILKPPNPPYRELVGALGIPTLLVIGDKPVVTLDMATALREINPCLRVDQIDDAGHGLPFDQPGPLARSVLTFVRGLPNDI